MQVRATRFPEVKRIEPRHFGDARGQLLELWSRPRYAAHGIPTDFVQANHSINRAGAVRGLHFRVGVGQEKLVWVVRGRILDVVLDIRRGSPTFGTWTSVELSADNHHQLYIPAGFAHGFVALEDAEVQYLLSDCYRPELERGVSWRDPSLALPWPGTGAVLSDRDAALPRLADVSESDFPPYPL